MTAFPRSLMIFLMLLLLAALYAPAIGGAPLWDDHPFIFSRFFFDKNFSHWSVWRYHIWPLFDSASAVLFQIFGGRPLPWHLLNLALHGFNAVLAARLLARFYPRGSTPLLLLFLVHPLCVLSVAWIIQLKTLLCASFVLLAALAWFKGRDSGKKTFYLLAWLLFFCSVNCKSASLPLPFLLLVGSLGQRQWSRTVCIIPFLLISLFSIMRIMGNPQVQDYIQGTEVVTAKMMEAPPTVAIAVESKVVPEPETPPMEIALSAPSPLIPPPVIMPRPELPPTPSSTARVSIVLHSLGSYVFMSFWPWPLAPSHGPFNGAWSWRAMLGLGIFLGLVFLSIRRRDFLLGTAVVGALFSLSPFLGIILFPAMSYSMVSEQHLYLALPFLLVVQLWLWDKIPWRWAPLALALWIGSLAFVTLDYTPAFHDEDAFFGRVLEQRPNDLFMRLNLAASYQNRGDYRRAKIILQKTLDLAETHPEWREDHAWSEILRSYELSTQMDVK